MSRRLLVIGFPRLASDLHLRRQSCAAPFALILRHGTAERIYCLNAEASALGLGRGMGLADARAIFPELITAPADPVKVEAGLQALRRLCQRYAPQVGIDGPDGLVADITGVAHLFGGEAELREDLHARLERAGFSLQSAIAQTRGAAWALSRHGGGIIPEGALTERLGPLPVSALRLSDEQVEGLIRMGLSQIRDLIDLPRAPLARRFGPDLMRRLDQMLGHLPEPIATFTEPPHFGLRMSLPEAIGLTKDVMAGLERLLQRLCAKLALAQMGARRLRFELHRVDREVIRIEVGLARAMRDPARIAALFTRHVEAVDAGFGIDALRLEAHVVEPLAPEQIGGQGANAEDELADLISRLGNRLGFGQITRLHAVDSHLPERSFLRLPATQSPPPNWPEYRGPERPIILFRPEPLGAVFGHPPSRFHWRRRAFTTLRAHGPERITPDWWQIDPAWAKGLRDYWRIETREGPRLWLFHTPQAPGWSVQGEFL